MSVDRPSFSSTSRDRSERLRQAYEENEDGESLLASANIKDEDRRTSIDHTKKENRPGHSRGLSSFMDLRPNSESRARTPSGLREGIEYDAGFDIIANGESRQIGREFTTDRYNKEDDHKAFRSDDRSFPNTKSVESTPKLSFMDDRSPVILANNSRFEVNGYAPPWDNDHAVPPAPKQNTAEKAGVILVRKTTHLFRVVLTTYSLAFFQGIHNIFIVVRQRVTAYHQQREKLI